jgi:hypothetical protein
MRVAGQPIEQSAVGIGGSTHVEACAEPAVIADLELDLAECILGRALGHVVQDAARADLAIEDGGRPAQDLEPFGAIRIDRHEGSEFAALLPEPVAIEGLVRDVEAAQLEEQAARVGPVRLAGRAGGIAEHVAHLGGALRLQLIGGDDGDGLRRFDQWRGCLRR